MRTILYLKFILICSPHRYMVKSTYSLSILYKSLLQHILNCICSHNIKLVDWKDILARKSLTTLKIIKILTLRILLTLKPERRIWTVKNDIRLDDICYGYRADCIAVGNLGMGKSCSLFFVQFKQYLAPL